MNVVSAPLRFLINVEQYHRMGEVGIIPPDTRVELIEGEVLTMPPIGTRHASAVATLVELLTDARLATRGFIWPQNPVVLSLMSELQPDIVLLRRREDAYRDSAPQPEDVLLLIEVADTTLPFDRRRKVPLYARHGIVEAWIVNIPGRCLEVFRDPGELGYSVSFVRQVNEDVAPVEFPDVFVQWGKALGQ